MAVFLFSLFFFPDGIYKKCKKNEEKQPDQKQKIYQYIIRNSFALKRAYNILYFLYPFYQQVPMPFFLHN